MKTAKIIYWSTTVIFSLMMLFSAYNYFYVEDVKQAFVHLGFPDYFRIELGIAKLLGAIVLLLPKLPYKVKFFAYAGFTINLISATIAHAASGDAISYTIMPVIFLAFLAVSFLYYEKLNKA